MVPMTRYIPRGRPVAGPNRIYAERAALALGPTQAARAIGISPTALLAACAGLPVYSSTEARIHQARLAGDPIP